MSSNRIDLFKTDASESVFNDNGSGTGWKWGDNIEPSQDKVSEYNNKPTVKMSDLKAFPVMSFKP